MAGLSRTRVFLSLWPGFEFDHVTIPSSCLAAEELQVAVRYADAHATQDLAHGSLDLTVMMASDHTTNREF